MMSEVVVDDGRLSMTSEKNSDRSFEIPPSTNVDGCSRWCSRDLEKGNKENVSHTTENSTRRGDE